MPVVRNDHLLNLTYSIAQVISIVPRGFCGHIWQFLGPRSSYLMNLSLNLLINLLLLFCGKSVPVFLLVVLGLRSVAGFSYLFNYHTIFTFYESEISIKVIQIFDYSFIVLAVLVVGIN